MRIPVELTADDLIRLHRIHEQSLVWFRRPYLITLIIVLIWGAIGLLAIATGLVLIPSNSNYAVKYYAIASIGILVCICEIFWYPQRHTSNVTRNVRRNKDGFKLEQFELEVDSYGVKDHGEHSTEYYSWQEIFKVVYSQDDVCIYISKIKAIIIPGRSFANLEIRESFLGIVEQNVPRRLISRTA